MCIAFLFIIKTISTQLYPSQPQLPLPRSNHHNFSHFWYLFPYFQITIWWYFKFLQFKYYQFPTVKEEFSSHITLPPYTLKYTYISLSSNILYLKYWVDQNSVITGLLLCKYDLQKRMFVQWLRFLSSTIFCFPAVNNSFAFT